ncbi:hypothetical protein IV203_012524 [Nitzschia inconspicua]|uniref:Uncharacterized protein n=1 Tax=Nitzschia inconspicua TaxID=303405 RepID=A0A9K3K6W7_9STRA|nr:hypothetical protein IV203_012709 [Nitzschia inconspicua]KAG7349927.1 hypothetical protein IV203_012524 [Nitzschia inconspicua]
MLEVLRRAHTSRHKEPSTNTVYRAPRLAAVPYKHDVQDQRRQQNKRRQRRLRAGELAQTLKAQYGDAPDQEDIHGGGNTDLYGKQRSASKKLAQLEADRTEYEENAMTRLMVSRKEKKERKRIERMLQGGRMGNLVREMEKFGRDVGNIHNDDDKERNFHHQTRALEDFHNNQGGAVSNANNNNNNNKRHANGKRRPEKDNNNHAEHRDSQSKKGKTTSKTQKIVTSCPVWEMRREKCLLTVNA